MHGAIVCFYYTQLSPGVRVPLDIASIVVYLYRMVRIGRENRCRKPSGHAVYIAAREGMQKWRRVVIYRR